MIPRNQFETFLQRCQLLITAILLCFWACTFSLHAEEYRSVEFKAFQLRPGNFPELYFLNAKNQKAPIDFKKKSRTEMLESKVNVEDNLLHFFITSANTSGNQPANPIASVWINPKWSEPLIIFSDQSTKEQANYVAIAIEDDFRQFPIGSVKILNLTGVEIIGSIDGQVIEMPNATASDRFKLNDNERIEVAIAAQSAERHHLLYKNTLSLNSTTRSLLLLRPPKRSGSVKIQGQLLIEYAPNEESSSAPQ